MSLWQRERLENGMTVLYRRDASLPLTHASLLLRTGSVEETPEQAGLASLTLDIMMEGTQKRTARQIADAMESIGGSLGGQTHDDYTDFGFIVPAAHLPRALDVLADILRYPAFRESDINKQRKEVLADLASRSDSNFNLTYDAFMDRLFPGHAYGRPVEGRAEAVKKFKRRDFQAWHAAHLRPGKMILSLMGPWTFEKTLRVIQKYFSEKGGQRHGGGPRGSLTALMPLSTIKPSNVKIRSPFQQAFLMEGYRAPRYGEPLYLPLKLANIAIGGGMSSRLFWELREKRGLAYDVSSFYSSRTHGGTWAFYLGLPKEKLPAARRALEELIARVARQGITAKELLQSKRMMRGGYLMENQPRRRQTWYGAWWTMQGKDPEHGLQFLEELDKVTLKDVHEAIQGVLEGPKVVVEVVPK